MRLIIGGANQGKLNWYLAQNQLPSEEISDGKTTSLDTLPQGKILNHLDSWIFRLLEAKYNPEKIIEQYLEKNPDAVIICDEIGCGVVPITANEREWREVTGRICCNLAKKANRVDRIFCGLAMPLKKEDSDASNADSSWKNEK